MEGGVRGVGRSEEVLGVTILALHTPRVGVVV